jgi:hypothetical protein
MKQAKTDNYYQLALKLQLDQDIHIEEKIKCLNNRKRRRLLLVDSLPLKEDKKEKKKRTKGR